jgi:hypothetical protein
MGIYIFYNETIITNANQGLAINNSMLI